MNEARDQPGDAIRPIATSEGGLRGLLARLDALHGAGAAALLGIVVATEGSTYQKPGALVLLDRSGVRHGVISGGCLEPELERRAAAVFESGRAALVDFDTRSDDDLVFGSGTGCRGRVHLLLLPQPSNAPLAQALHACIAHGERLDLALMLDAATIGAGQARIGAQAPAWAWDATGAPAPAPDRARAHALSIAPPPRVLLLGAGPETPALVAAINRLGWRVTVLEHRGRWSAFADAGKVDRRIDAAPAAALAELGDERCGAAVVMSHNFTLDRQYLAYCAAREIGYVGLLGPPARRDALLADLGVHAEALRSRLRAPVGLDLGGSGPEAIALAIVAELQQFFART